MLRGLRVRIVKCWVCRRTWGRKNVTVEGDDVFLGDQWIAPAEEWEAMSEAERNAMAACPIEVVPDNYASAKLSDFGDSNSAYVARLFAERWKDARAGLYIYGGVGAGKTHLLAATVATVCGAGADAIWWTEDCFFDDIWADYRDKRDLWGVAERKDIVAFDDLFEFGRWNDWKREQVNRLIHRLYMSNTKMLITSNVTWTDLHAGVTGIEASSLSRLKEMVYSVEMFGPDRRERPRRSE